MDENWNVAVSDPLCPTRLLPLHLLPPVSAIFLFLCLFFVALFCTPLFFSLYTRISRGSAETTGVWVSITQAVQNWGTSLEIWPTWLLPYDKIKSGMVESWGDTLLLHAIDKVYIQAMFVRCQRNFIIWERYLLGHYCKLFWYIGLWQHTYYLVTFAL